MKQTTRKEQLDRTSTQKSPEVQSKKRERRKSHVKEKQTKKSTNQIMKKRMNT